MKLLHTADWHIGKQLLKQDLSEDHRLYFDFLIETIESEKIDVLLISGDVFDLANPSNQSKNLYYNVLRRLIDTKTKVIITGGNHDSVAHLEASKDILSYLDITVIGGAKEDLSDELIVIENEDGKEVAVVAAVPFLRDKDLRTSVAGQSQIDKIRAVQDGIVAHFRSISILAKEKYPNIPIIGMGHLFVQGASLSESERDIQIGNQAGVGEDSFIDLFDYLALGHIHIPQKINDDVRYSGSPISLSFSERKDQKKMIMLELTKGKVSNRSISVPKYRSLVRLVGSLSEVQEEFLAYINTDVLPSLVEMEIISEFDDPSIVVSLQEWLKEMEAKDVSRRAIIVKTRIKILNQSKSMEDLYDETTLIEDLSPLEIFEKRLANEELLASDKDLLLEAHQEVLDEIYQNENQA